MLWIPAVLLADAFWSLMNIFDKAVVSNYTKSPIASSILACIAGMLITIPLAILFPFKILETGLLAIFALDLILWAFAVFLYYKAVQESEASRVTVAMSTIPLFTLAFAVFFLGESLSMQKIAGILLLVLGAALVSLKKAKGTKSNRWILLVFAATAIFGLDTVVAKFLLAGTDWWSLAVQRNLIAGLIFACIAPFYFKKISEPVKTKPKLLPLLLAGESLYITGSALFILALSLGPASLVSALTSLQPFVVLLFAVFFTKFFPSFLKEEIDKSHLAVKLAAVALAVAGAAMLA